MKNKLNYISHSLLYAVNNSFGLSDIAYLSKMRFCSAFAHTWSLVAFENVKLRNCLLRFEVVNVALGSAAEILRPAGSSSGK